MKIVEMIKERRRPFYSLEFFPPREMDQWPDFFTAAKKLQAIAPLYVSVTYGAGGGTQANTLEITARLRQCGFTPMPHVTCVGATRERVAGFLTQLRELGVDNVMALRGDAPPGQNMDRAKGEFHFAADLVAFIHREFPDFGIAVAGYPGAHPEAPTFVDDRLHTKAKLEAGGDFIVTQLFFDVREYFEMVGRLRDMGVDKPVVPGILPIQSLESIRRILSLCDANIPGNLYLKLEEANGKGGPKAVKEAGIAFAAGQIRRLLDGGAPGIHLYTLNRADTCLRIVEAVGDL